MLPAISGIAKQTYRPEMGDYLAGLWSTHLSAMLLWRATVRMMTTFPGGLIDGQPHTQFRVGLGRLLLELLPLNSQKSTRARKTS
jgi:hypothetical protein